MAGRSPAQQSDRILEALATAIVLVDAHECVTFLNTAAEGLLGVSERRALGRPLPELVPGLEDIAGLCRRARERQRSFGQTLHIVGPQLDGTETELAARVSPYPDQDPGAVLVEFFDITQRHHLDRESALVAQRGVSRRMLQQLAHEIRNPLGGLRGAAQLLEGELDDPSLHEFTRVIIGEADRLESLVAGLLGPRGRPDRQPLNVHEVLQRVLQLVGSEYPSIELLRDYDPSLPDLLADRDQLTQALLNLVRNAAQAVDHNGTITLRTRIASNHVLNAHRYKLVALIEIEDDGPGVPDEFADTIFYPLVTGREDGSGIGLPLAQELVNRHAGLIEFTSRPGKTVFTVSLPVLSDDDAPEAIPA